jgi:hypothetical protein
MPNAKASTFGETCPLDWYSGGMYSLVPGEGDVK